MTGTKPRTKAERMRVKALTRWENEGGAAPCGPLVPGGDPDCAVAEAADAKGGGREDGRKEA